MENEKGYKNSFNYNQYGIEIKGYSTTSEHAKEYGIYAVNPFYLQHLFVNEPDRNKGKGKQALEIIDNYAKEKKYDVIFGYIDEKAVFTKNKESFFNDADLIKYWLHDNGYAVNKETNEFHKIS